jgi:hypothetical protein
LQRNVPEMIKAATAARAAKTVMSMAHYLCQHADRAGAD